MGLLDKLLKKGPKADSVSKGGSPIYHYDEKKDPIECCPICGRKNGNGDNNTCQKWIVDFTCPKCGQLVKANECHTHG